MIPPDDLQYVVGVGTYTSDINFVTWYCYNDGKLYDCTANEENVLAPNLPPVTGVASKLDGSLIILYGGANCTYQFGDITRPTGSPFRLPCDVEMIDIATNGDGEVIVGLCQQGGKLFDCIGNPPRELKQLNDQSPVALSWGDDSGEEPQIWCRVIEEGKATAKRCP
jgi:hypothetical protein